MRLTNPGAQIYVPDGSSVDAALVRTTHLAVGAHPDDVPIIGMHGIGECLGRDDAWFLGVTLTDGASSPRSGPYRDHTDDQMRAVRIDEEKQAAAVGGYSAAVLLDYPSSAARDPSDLRPEVDLAAILTAARPGVVYAHDPTDRHDTHVAAALRTIAAIRSLPSAARPRRLYGCEVWRGLDWLSDEDKVILDVSGCEDLAADLLGVYGSQISGGKRYDLAVIGRRRAHATFAETHSVDVATALIYAMDLTPLVDDPTVDIETHLAALVERMRREATGRISTLGGAPRRRRR